MQGLEVLQENTPTLQAPRQVIKANARGVLVFREARRGTRVLAFACGVAGDSGLGRRSSTCAKISATLFEKAIEQPRYPYL